MKIMFECRISKGSAGRMIQLEQHSSLHRMVFISFVSVLLGSSGFNISMGFMYDRNSFRNGTR